MPHAKSLRAIGQSLEAFGIVAFVVEKNGRNYVVRSDALPDLARLDAKKDLSEKVWDNRSPGRQRTHFMGEDGSWSYDPAYVSWLDAQGRKKRRRRFTAQATGTMKVSQLLRTLGKHLDRLEPHTLKVSWSKNSIIIDCQLSDGQQIREVMSMDKLRELTVRSRFRRVRRRRA